MVVVVVGEKDSRSEVAAACDLNVMYMFKAPEDLCWVEGRDYLMLLAVINAFTLLCYGRSSKQPLLSYVLDMVSMIVSVC